MWIRSIASDVCQCFILYANGTCYGENLPEPGVQQAGVVHNDELALLHASTRYVQKRFRLRTCRNIDNCRL